MQSKKIAPNLAGSLHKKNRETSAIVPHNVTSHNVRVAQFPTSLQDIKYLEVDKYDNLYTIYHARR